ncbi:MAG: Lrp/AsnC family transcriptional regulator [Planctomycetota bacterium]
MAKVSGYVFVEVGTRHVADVLEGLNAIEGVTAAHAVTGRYDVIAQVTAPKFSELANTVLAELRQIDGVLTTETALVIPEPRDEL